MPSNEHSNRSKFGFIPYGGLGNQLFQFATVLSLTKIHENKFHFDLLGNTNNSPDGLPEIFKLGNISEVEIRQRGKLARAIGSKLSKGSIKLSSVNTNSAYKLVARKFLNAIIRGLVYTFLRASICYPVGVGYDSNFNERVGIKSTIIGNFHSYMWISLESKTYIIDQFSKTEFSETVLQFRERAKITKPIAVHIRLGDYELIDELNVVSREYFDSALEILTKSGINQEIWIFTNDKEKSTQFISAASQEMAIWIPDSLNSLETLEVMRQCHSFIISNSTFSWWAAFLANEADPSVIAPKVWIKNHPEPLEICPPQWQRI